MTTNRLLVSTELPSIFKPNTIQLVSKQSQHHQGAKDLKLLQSIIHGELDSKRRKISKKVAVSGYIPSQATHTGTLYVHNESSSITNTFAPGVTRTAITTANNHSQISTKSISTQTPSTINAQTAVAATNSAITMKEIHCISQSTSGKYIVIALTDGIPNVVSKSRHRHNKRIHHRRNDSLANLIGFICNNKNLCMYNDNMKSWNEVMCDKNELKRSQRDILKLTRIFLDKLSNGNTEQLLWSLLSLQCNLDVKNYICDQFAKQDQSQLTQLLSNISKCANNTVDHEKYEWAMPVLATFDSHAKAQQKGFKIGKKAWDRAWRLYSTTNCNINTCQRT